MMGRLNSLPLKKRAIAGLNIMFNEIQWIRRVGTKLRDSILASELTA